MIDTLTLQQARDYVAKNREDGVSCPCCGLYCKDYRRKINAEAARFLCRVIVQFGRTRDWVNVRDVIETNTFASTNGTHLVHWGLLEHGEKGFWKPTAKGIEFAKGKIRVQKYVILYDNKPLRFEGALVDIKQCLKERFDFDEIMRLSDSVEQVQFIQQALL